MIMMVDDVAWLNIVDEGNNVVEEVLMLDSNSYSMIGLIEDYMYTMK